MCCTNVLLSKYTSLKTLYVHFLSLIHLINKGINLISLIEMLFLFNYILIISFHLKQYTILACNLCFFYRYNLCSCCKSGNVQRYLTYYARQKVLLCISYLPGLINL